MGIPAISVLVAVYNTEVYLPQCLDSIKNQSFTDFEVICIDDGSSDKSLIILNEYAATDSRFLVHHQSNHGVGYTKSLALARARGKYFFILDSDDFIEFDTLEVMYGLAEKTNAQIVGFPCDSYVEEEGKYLFNPAALHKDYLPEASTFSVQDIPATIFQVFTPAVWNKLWLRSFVEENGMSFDNYPYAEDYYLMYWAMAVAERISVCQGKAYYHYREGRAGSLTAVSDERPLLFMPAYCALREKLLSLGIYQQLEQSYLNLTLAGIRFEFLKLRTVDAKKKLAAFLREEGFALLGLKDYGARYYYDRDDYLVYQDIIKPPSVARRLLRKMGRPLRRFFIYLKKHGLKATMQRFVGR